MTRFHIQCDQIKYKRPALRINERMNCVKQFSHRVDIQIQMSNINILHTVKG